MIVQPVPHSAKYISAVCQFTANFNAPLIGGYDFNIPSNKGISLIKFNLNSHYFIDTMSISGDIASEDFLDAINVIPAMRLKKSATGENIYPKDLPLAGFIEGKEASIWVHSDKSNDFLVADINGSLNQTATLVWTPSIQIYVSFSIFEISDKDYEIAIRDTLKPSFARKVNA